MIRHLVAFFSGVVFAVGLAVSGMTQPSKVVGFLDVTGAWDPSLAFVMAGAIAVYTLAYRWSLARAAPFLATYFPKLGKSRIDGRLLAGAGIFGIGWGLAGYCPGPGIASLGAGSAKALVFVGAMVGGMVLVRVVEQVVRPHLLRQRAA